MYFSFFFWGMGVVFRTDRSEPNWDRCVTEVENRFLRFSRDLLIRYKRSWAYFDGGDEGYATKKKITEIGSLEREIIFSDHQIESSRVRIGSPKSRSDPIFRNTIEDAFIELS